MSHDRLRRTFPLSLLARPAILCLAAWLLALGHSSDGVVVVVVFFTADRSGRLLATSLSGFLGRFGGDEFLTAAHQVGPPGFDEGFVDGQGVCWL